MGRDEEGVDEVGEGSSRSSQNTAFQPVLLGDHTDRWLSVGRGV